ncbi:MAG: hypothetical protein SPF40_04995 [Prevotella sp.]|nr:hypothetical protein [Prevotella sp.]
MRVILYRCHVMAYVMAQGMKLHRLTGRIAPLGRYNDVTWRS